MDAETRKALHDRLEKIRLRNETGVLTPDDVVKDARSETSPLHQFFTWDDSEAAHQFRLDQARTLIRNVKVEVSTTHRTIVAPFYVRDPRVSPDEQGYAPVAELKDELSVAVDALRYEFDRAIALLERSVSIAEVLGISGQVTELLQRARVIHDNLPVGPFDQRERVRKGKAKTVSARA